VKPIILCSFVVATAASVAAFAGCEGEPPVVAPGNASGLASEPPATEASSSGPMMGGSTMGGPMMDGGTMDPSMMGGRTMAGGMTAGGMMDGGMGGAMGCPPPPCTQGAAPSGAAASASAAESGPSLPVPPPSVPRGNVVGTVTTHPTGLASLAVVYLEDGPQEDAPSRLQTVTIANKQMNFLPYVSVVATGGKVVFANEDPFPHNVFSPDGEKFNMGNIPQNGAHVRVFKTPGAYSLLCNLHPGMLGYLVVTPSTWAARTDGKGRYALKHVPVGTYKVTTWAPRLPPVTQSVTVAEGDVTLDFDLHR